MTTLEHMQEAIQTRYKPPRVHRPVLIIANRDWVDQMRSELDLSEGILGSIVLWGHPVAVVDHPWETMLKWIRDDTLNDFETFIFWKFS